MKRTQPDRAALEIAHRELGAELSLNAMLGHPTHRIILENRARQHMQRRARIDLKRLQANDKD